MNLPAPPTPVLHRPATRRLVLTAALACAGTLTGCSAWQAASADSPPVQPGDFVADDPRPDGPAAATTPAADTTPVTETTPAQTPTSASDRALAVDAMIGHVNGDAIYAQVILDPIDAELAAFGRRYDGDEFLQRAAPVIAGRLKEVLIDDVGAGGHDRIDHLAIPLGQSLALELNQMLGAEGDLVLDSLGQFHNFGAQQSGGLLRIKHRPPAKIKSPFVAVYRGPVQFNRLGDRSFA